MNLLKFTGWYEFTVTYTFATSLIPVKRIRASGNLRLVITGVTDQGQLFVTYKDIEIID